MNHRQNYVPEPVARKAAYFAFFLGAGAALVGGTVGMLLWGSGLL